MDDKRKQLLERANKIRFVPGHGPDINSKTDEELEQWVNIMESMFRLAFEKEDELSD